MAAETGNATLSDLRNEDKLKIGNLLRELARAQREGQQATQERSQYAARLRKMRSQNDLIVQETVMLRGKFRQSLQLLKSYQQRIGGIGEPSGDSVVSPRPAGEASAPPMAFAAAAGREDAADAVPPHARETEIPAALQEERAAPAAAGDGKAAQAQLARTQAMDSLRERYPHAAAAYEVRHPDDSMEAVAARAGARIALSSSASSRGAIAPTDKLVSGAASCGARPELHAAASSCSRALAQSVMPPSVVSQVASENAGNRPRVSGPAVAETVAAVVETMDVGVPRLAYSRAPAGSLPVSLGGQIGRAMSLPHGCNAGSAEPALQPSARGHPSALSGASGVDKQTPRAGGMFEPEPSRAPPPARRGARQPPSAPTPLQHLAQRSQPSGDSASGHATHPSYQARGPSSSSAESIAGGVHSAGPRPAFAWPATSGATAMAATSWPAGALGEWAHRETPSLQPADAASSKVLTKAAAAASQLLAAAAPQETGRAADGKLAPSSRFFQALHGPPHVDVLQDDIGELLELISVLDDLPATQPHRDGPHSLHYDAGARAGAGHPSKVDRRAERRALDTIGNGAAPPAPPRSARRLLIGGR